MIIIFSASLLLLLYIYLGYPVAALFLARIINREVYKAPYEPSVTILIAAYNEEEHIERTVENKLELDYPDDRLEIIVISDQSDDRTDDIVKSFSDKRVKFLRQEPRRGKTSALNLAMPHASGEIIVFSDANSIYEKQALRYLVENFSDPSVGYVTGKMIYINHDGTIIGNGCSTYMRYENLLREVETKIGSVVGVDGGVDAVRKSLYREMRHDQLPDFVLPLMVVEQGYRVVYEPRAVLMEDTLKSPEDENRMRVRVSLRALWALFDMRVLFNPLRYGIFSVQLFSHKVLRYLGIIFVVAVYVSNIVLISRSMFYKLFFVLQSVVLGMALAGRHMEKKGMSSHVFYIPYYFFLINIAAGQALLKFLRGEKQATWAPRKG